MKLNRTIALCLVFVVTFSFAGLILKQKNASLGSTANYASESATANRISYNLLAAPAFTNYPLTVLTHSANVNVAETPAIIFNNATRTEIYDFIKTNPGVQFRGICNELGLSIGLAQFHLGILTKSGLVSFFRDGKYKRFFESKRFSKKQVKIISVLRHETAGSILRVILERKQVSHGELTHELSITSQGLTWHMNLLRKSHLIVESKANKKLLYSIKYANTALLTEMAKLLEQT